MVVGRGEDDAEEVDIVDNIKTDCGRLKDSGLDVRDAR
jgi:hypothetical protein